MILTYPQLFVMIINQIIIINSTRVVASGRPRPANLRVGQLCEIVNGAIFGSMIMITYMRLVKIVQKSQAFLAQMGESWQV